MKFVITVVIMLLLLNAVLMSVVMVRVSEYKEAIDQIASKSRTEEQSLKADRDSTMGTQEGDSSTSEPKREESIFSDLNKKKTKTPATDRTKTQPTDKTSKDPQPEDVEIKKEIPSTLSEKTKILLQEAEGFNKFWRNMDTLNMLKTVMNEDEFYTLMISEVANFLQLTPEQKQYFLNQSQTILFQVKLYEQESTTLADLYKKDIEKYDNDYNAYYQSPEYMEYIKKRQELSKKRNKFVKEASEMIRAVIPKDTIKQKLFSEQVDRIIKYGMMGGSSYQQYYYGEYYDFYGE